MKPFVLHILVLCVSTCVSYAASCSELTEIHLNSLHQHLVRINYIKVVIIHEGEPPPTRYVQQLLVRWFDNGGVPVLLQSYSLDFEDEVYDYIELFSWSGKHFPLRSTQNANQLVFDNRNRSVAFNRNEGGFGVFAVVNSLNTLEQFLQGTPRRPFHTPRGEYVIAIMENFSEDSKLSIDSILRKLWTDYGILNAVLYSTCDNKIYSLDPFNHRNGSNIVSQDIFQWGILKENYLENLTFKNIQLKKQSRNLKGYPIRSVIFRRNPTAEPWKNFPASFVKLYSNLINDTNDIGGFDGIFYHNIVKALNLTPVSMKGSERFGYRADNKTYVGSLGDVLYSKADISVNPRFIQDYGSVDIEFLQPVYFDLFCIIAPKARLIPDSVAVFKCFTERMWCLISLSVLILGFLWKYFRPKEKSDAAIILQMLIIMTTGIPNYKSFKTSERIFLSGCFLASIILGSTFQGSLITSYTTETFYKDIDTLQELDESGLPISTSSKSLLNMFGKNQSALITSLQKKLILKDQDSVHRTAVKRDTCCVERLNDFAIIKEMYKSGGIPMLHAVMECPRFYSLSYVVRKGWPFTQHFNDIILRFTEAGLTTKWYQDTKNALIGQLHHKTHEHTSTSEKKPFSIKNVQSAFFVLAFGLCLSIIVFLIEFFKKHN